MWILEKDGCKQGLHQQPSGPMAIILFCEDAVGNYAGLVYYGHMEAPSPTDFVRKLSESEKNSFYKIWSLGNRMWQDPVWASDVTSYAWGPDGMTLYIATSGIYGSGVIYELDLVRRSYKQIVPSGKKFTTSNPGPGFIITRLDTEKEKLFYKYSLYKELSGEDTRERSIKIKHK